jgi:hypothetical protein
VITYSSGNHAQGVAYAARALGARAVIVMPSNAPQVKRDATAAYGAEIVEVGPGSDERRIRGPKNSPLFTASSSFRLTTTSTSSPGRARSASRSPKTCPASNSF